MDQGRQRVRVSTLIDAFGLIGDERRWYTEGSSERGTAVHTVLSSTLNGERVSVRPKYSGYADAVMKFIADTGLKGVLVERRLSDDMVTGKPDIIGYFTRYSPIVRSASTVRLWWPVVLDGKTSEPKPWHGVQLAFYQQLADVSNARELLPTVARELPWLRIGAYFRPDGTYRMECYSSEDDFAVADSIRRLTAWRFDRGVIELPKERYDDDEPGTGSVI